MIYNSFVNVQRIDMALQFYSKFFYQNYCQVVIIFCYTEKKIADLLFLNEHPVYFAIFLKFNLSPFRKRNITYGYLEK